MLISHKFCVFNFDRILNLIFDLFSCNFMPRTVPSKYYMSIAPNKTQLLTPHLHHAIPKIPPQIAMTVARPCD